MSASASAVGAGSPGSVRKPDLPVVTARITGETYNGRDIVQLSTGKKLVVQGWEGKYGIVIAFPYQEWYATKKAQNSASLILGALVGLSVGGCMVAFTVTSVGIAASAALGSALIVAGLGLLLVRCFNDYVDPEVKMIARDNAIIDNDRDSIAEDLISPVGKRMLVEKLYGGGDGITLANFMDLVKDIRSLQEQGIISQEAARACFIEDAVARYETILKASFPEKMEFVTQSNEVFRKNYTEKYASWNKTADYANVPSDVQAAILAAYAARHVRKK